MKVQSILRRAAATTMIAAGLGAAPAAAAPGVPDPGFAFGGVKEISFAGHAAQARRIIPADTGFAVVGETETTTSAQGAIAVAGLAAGGQRDGTFGGLVPWDMAGPTAADAIRAAGNRLVIAANGTPGDAFPNRIRLIGTGTGGRPDGVFGAGGFRDITHPGEAVRLLNGPGGTILVAGVSNAGDGTPNGALLVRLTPDGDELTTGVVPLGANAQVGGAVERPDGSVLLVGADPRLFVVRFRADGTPDPTFGTAGVAHLPVTNVQVDDARLDAAGRILVAGAHLGDLGRSVDVPVRPLLARLTATGTGIDGSLARVGRGPGDVDELTGVAPTGGGKILASSDDGRVLRFSGSGRPDLRFGAGGTSPAPEIRVFSTAGLTVVGNGAFLGGDSLKPSGFQNNLAVEKVRLTGSGLVRPRRRAFVQLHRTAGHVFVQVPVSPRDQPIGSGVTVPLLTRSINGGDGFFYTPPGAIAGAGNGTVRVNGVGGSATVQRARFTLRRITGRIAELNLAKVKCGARRTTRVRLVGKFQLRAGGRTIRNGTRKALFLIRRACGKQPKVVVLQGKVKVTP
ncbi:MAG TPA: hypothetical protein VGI54_02195 [Solirubrobacteraceae bacterium]